jgi:pyruvate,water dikinase
VLLPRARVGLARRENAKSEFVRVSALLRRALLEAGARLARKGLLAQGEDVFFLTGPELKDLLLARTHFDVHRRTENRRREVERYRATDPPMLVVGSSPVLAAAPDTMNANGTELRGVPASPGVATGPARVILHNDGQSRVLPGEILVAPVTDPAWSPYFLSAAGIVVDVGGILSHGSVVAREYGIPAVVNVGSGTRQVRTGQLLRVDGNRGVVTLL